MIAALAHASMLASGNAGPGKEPLDFTNAPPPSSFFAAIALTGLFASCGSSYGHANPQSNMLTTGDVKYDAYDCVILAMAEKYGHPDPRITQVASQ